MARILICEHNDDVRRLFELFVRRLGHEPVLADSGWNEEALDVDAVLLEPASPRAARVLRAVDGATRLIPVVGTSIYPRHELPRPREFAAYLLKPFTRDQLAHVLRAALP